MTNYGQTAYWNKRYENQESVTFDWLRNYDSLRNIINDACIKPRYDFYLEEKKKEAAAQKSKEQIRMEEKKFRAEMRQIARKEGQDVESSAEEEQQSSKQSQANEESEKQSQNPDE